MRMDRESPDGTLRPATGLGRVSGNVLHQVSSLTYPKEAGTSDGTLGPDRGLGRVSRQRQHREEPVPFPEFEGGLERPMLPRIGEEQGDYPPREQPASVHSLPAMEATRANVIGGLRRSARAWKPSGACLENIAHATLELTQAEATMDEEDKQPRSFGHGQAREAGAAVCTLGLPAEATGEPRGEPAHCERGTLMLNRGNGVQVTSGHSGKQHQKNANPHLVGFGLNARSWSGQGVTDTRRKRPNGEEEEVSALDHARWFWESIYRTSESGFCPRNHSEAMTTPG